MANYIVCYEPTSGELKAADFGKQLPPICKNEPINGTTWAVQTHMDEGELFSRLADIPGVGLNPFLFVAQIVGVPTWGALYPQNATSEDVLGRPLSVRNPT